MLKNRLIEETLRSTNERCMSLNGNLDPESGENDK